MLRAVALHAIAGYQRHLSPRKRWRCAYGVHTGRSSCSDFGRRAVDAYGVLEGVRLILRRFQGCRRAALALAAPNERKRDASRSSPVGASEGGADKDLALCCTVAEIASYAAPCA